MRKPFPSDITGVAFAAGSVSALADIQSTCTTTTTKLLGFAPFPKPECSIICDC